VAIKRPSLESDLDLLLDDSAICASSCFPKIGRNNFLKIVNLNSNNTLMQLRKICNHPYLTLEDCRSIPDELYHRHLISASGKLAVLSSLLGHLIPRGHKVLIFCQMTNMLDILQGYLHEAGYLCYRLDGNTDRHTRDRIIREFQNGADRGDGEKVESLERDGAIEEEQEEVYPLTTIDSDDSDKADDEEEFIDLPDRTAELTSIFLLSTRAGKSPDRDQQSCSHADQAVLALTYSVPTL
jgi:hypothetical protein